MRPHLILILAMIASPALAAEPVSPEAPVSTAGAMTSVADQIDAYLKSSPALEASDGGLPGVVPSDDRKPHGEIAIGVGTGGYRSVYARTDLPVGENGRISIAIEDTRFSRPPWPPRRRGPQRRRRPVAWPVVADGTPAVRPGGHDAPAAARRHRRPPRPMPRGQVRPLDHVEIGLNQSNLEKRDRSHTSGAGSGGKPVPTFPQPALDGGYGLPAGAVGSGSPFAGPLALSSGSMMNCSWQATQTS